jgi:hypothetical protein
MKPLIFITSLLFAVISVCNAQNVTDTHPGGKIYVIDYQSGQAIQATSDPAILFKDAFIDLASNTNTARSLPTRAVPGRKSYVITQMNDQSNGNGYQLTLQSITLNQTNTLYTFFYNIDQNALYFYNEGQQSWVPEVIQGNNMTNLNNCMAFAKFNDPNNSQPANSITNQPADQTADTPVDNDVSANTPPPALPEYDQPECPQDGYLWQPGFWAYSLNNNGYYWVPGAWVAAPDPGLLWTPPYWGFDGGIYVFHTGYWGNSIGFYGGINYGYGYGGTGFVGGEWHEGHFRYNTAVVRVNTTVIHNTYVDRTVISNTTMNNRSSFNGRGGIMAKPNDHEMAAMHEHHIMATGEQNRNQRIARGDKSQFASANGGRPGNLATPKVPSRTANFTGGQRMGGNPGATNANPGQSGPNKSMNTNPGQQGPNKSMNTNPGQQGPNKSVNANPGQSGPNKLVNANPGQPGSTNAGPGSTGPKSNVPPNNRPNPTSVTTQRPNVTSTNKPVNPRPVSAPRVRPVSMPKYSAPKPRKKS